MYGRNVNGQKADNAYDECEVCRSEPLSPRSRLEGTMGTLGYALQYQSRDEYLHRVVLIPEHS